jgi:hypothetical protein
VVIYYAEATATEVNSFVHITSFRLNKNSKNFWTSSRPKNSHSYTTSTPQSSFVTLKPVQFGDPCRSPSWSRPLRRKRLPTNITGRALATRCSSSPEKYVSKQPRAAAIDGKITVIPC